jgi:hypothetical protein
MTEANVALDLRDMIVCVRCTEHTMGQNCTTRYHLFPEKPCTVRVVKYCTWLVCARDVMVLGHMSSAERQEDLTAYTNNNNNNNNNSVFKVPTP